MTVTGRRGHYRFLPYMLVFPTFFFVTIFTVYPTFRALVKSLFRQRLNIAKFRDPAFIGLENYIDLFGDPEFLTVLGNTLIYVLGVVPLSVVTAFLFAQLVNRKLKGIGVVRLALFHPSILPLVSAATIWMFLFTPDYGLFNSTIRFLGYSGPENWTANPNLALVSVMIVAFWKNAGFYMIFYLAGLQNLPTSVFEVARMEGAGPIRIAVSITLPLLKRTSLFVSTIAFITAFQAVDHIFVLTGGGPSDKSSILLFYMWQERFEQLDVGRASALTVILVVILLFFTISNFIISERKEVDNE
jgi:sn-glycerol 3-phosphate transport system permease protein